MALDLRKSSYRTQEFSVSELVSSGSDLANENNLNILNDIYYQNEQNLQSYLKQIDERKDDVWQKPSDQRDSVKRLELKFILPEDSKSLCTSNQSLHDNQLLVNRVRLNKNLGKWKIWNNRRIDPVGAANSNAK